MSYHYYSTTHKLLLSTPTDQEALYNNRRNAGLCLGGGIDNPESPCHWSQDFISDRELSLQEQADLFIEPIEWLKMRLDREYASKMIGMR